MRFFRFWRDFRNASRYPSIPSSTVVCGEGSVSPLHERPVGSSRGMSRGPCLRLLSPIARSLASRRPRNSLPRGEPLLPLPRGSSPHASSSLLATPRSRRPVGAASRPNTWGFSPFLSQMLIAS